MISFTIPGQPISVNEAYERNRGRGQDRHLTPAGETFKTMVAFHALRAARKAGWFRPLDRFNIAVRIRYFFTSLRPDGDNPIKLTIDALQFGKVIKNDNRIVDYVIQKRKDPEKPRIEIDIYTVEEIR